MEKIITTQRTFFNLNTTKKVAFRIHQLKKLKSILKENEQLLNDAIYLDFKKSAFDNYTTELSLIHHDIDEAIKNVKKWSKVKRVRTNLVNLPGRSYVISEPLGIALIIGAWNYPYLTSLAPVVAAIAAGNTVILKPSELSANTSRIMHTIIDSNFDENYFSVVEGGISKTTTLLQQKFDKIFFTGSTIVGKIVYEAASKHLTPVTLELGGKSPAFITKSSNLKIAAKRLIWAKYLNSGQTCIAPDYILIDKFVKDEFLKLAKEEIKKAEYSFDNDNYIQIINQINTQRLINLIDKDKIYYGGEYNLAERYIEPTILENISFEDDIMKEEIFGPILPVIEYDNIDHAIAKVKSNSKPLVCYIYSENKKTKTKILNEVSFGSGAINDSNMHITNSQLPFGGVGESGLGSYHGKYGFNTFSHYKGILDKPTWFEFNLKYSPHTSLKMKIIKLLMGHKN